MSTHYKIDQDLREAQTMAEQLEDYVRGNELYGNAGGGFFSKMPSLTVGALLMRLRRLDALRDTLNSKQSEQLDNAQRQHDQVREAWQLHYREKMLQEAQSRLDAMRTFFEECARNPKSCYGIYKPEMSRRTIVQEILREMAAQNIRNTEIIERQMGVDGQLRGVVVAAGFQWDETLQAVYPADEFWWLYYAPAQQDDR